MKHFTSKRAANVQRCDVPYCRVHINAVRGSPNRTIQVLQIEQFKCLPTKSIFCHASVVIFAPNGDAPTSVPLIACVRSLAGSTSLDLCCRMVERTNSLVLRSG